MKKALLSVSDKNGIVNLARGLLELGYEILATQGTSQFLREQQIAVTEVAAYTKTAEMLGGRVKTLHPSLFAGVLALPEQQDEIKAAGISPIHLVVVNFYPKEIDIGGVALLRAAAKNYLHVLPIIDNSDYEGILRYLSLGEPDLAYRKKLAVKAFSATAQYDAVIAQSLNEEEFPQNLLLSFSKAYDLRYGENPDQRAAFYIQRGALPRSLINGGDLSYNNLLDSDAAMKLVWEFSEAACAIIKHTNPCGVASFSSLKRSFEYAYEADPLSAYGGIVAFNQKVDEEVALAIRDKFFEVLMAPEYDEKALELLGKKKRLRLLKAGFNANPFTFHAVSEGFLYQTVSKADFHQIGLRCVTKKIPSPDQVKDLLFAAKVNRHVKSNSIVIAKNLTTVGIGAGQMSRVDSMTMALLKAKNRAKGAVLSSDGFFPFCDAVDMAAQAGVDAIIQPGGSIRDQELIEACNAYGVAMVFTGVRTFRH
jgi:phosphoribosylaminoimidazolecarboxamide formyltransferase/IMP cyclohydrolase